MKKSTILAAAAGLLISVNSHAANINGVLQAIDLEKIATVIGEGENLAPVVVRFNNPFAVDNIVVGYRYDGAMPSAVAVMQAVAEADSRFAFSVAGQMRYELGLDLNGDQKIDEADNLLASGATGRWTFTTGTMGGAQGILFSFDGTALSSEDAPLFYLPASTEKGVWLPERISARMSDENICIQAYVQPQSDGIQTQSWQRSSSNTAYKNDATKLSSATAVTSRLYSMTGAFAGNEGVTYIRFRPKFSAGYIESNFCELTVLAPEVPIESLAWAESEVTGRLSHIVDNQLIFEPENATFTKVSVKSSATKVATASGTTPGAVKVTSTATAGEADITITYAANSEVAASYHLTTELQQPVEDITFEAVREDGKIHLTPKDMTGLFPIFTPEDPDIKKVTITLEGAGSGKSDYIATLFPCFFWDKDNVKVDYNELNGHRPGECTLRVTSGDGNCTVEIPVVVEEPDRTPLEGGYLDGTIMLNEEWFGHTNGGLNYITPEGEMMYQVYERENPGMSFGATSQYATIWGGRLIAASKQAADNGDPLSGGGRLVVADASTLKRIGSIDNLAWGDETGSADGRAVAGASPEKVYVGSTKGIYIVDLEKVEIIGKIGAIEGGGTDLYSGQIGDMVSTPGHVFAIKQSAGVYMIDTELDAVDKFIPASNVQGITMTADGHVWYAATVDGCSNFVELDPATGDELSRFILPAEYGQVTCSWGAWRNTAFVGCQSRNAIFFQTGGGGIIGGGSTQYLMWATGSDRVTVAADITGFEGSNSRVKQMNYGTLRYDDRSGELITMACDNGAKGHYRFNWYHYFNPDNGELLRTIEPKPYYWFQCFAIFPDKYAPEIALNDEIELSEGKMLELDIANLVTDADNIDANIGLTLNVTGQISAAPELMAADDDGEDASEADDVASFAIEDGKLKIAALKQGSATARLSAMSNGVVTEKDFTVNVKGARSSLAAVDAYAARSIICDGSRVIIKGYNGTVFTLYDPAGRLVDTFAVDADVCALRCGDRPGMYILVGGGVSAKVLVK